MRVLVDTHAFLWAAVEPHRLSTMARIVFEDPQHDVVLSVASIWEMQIKHQLGKLEVVTEPIAEIVERQQLANAIEILPVYMEHALAIDQLPMHHRDPSDRLLIAQALVEDVSILTDDARIQQYAVRVLW